MKNVGLGFTISTTVGLDSGNHSAVIYLTAAIVDVASGSFSEEETILVAFL